MSKVLIHLAAAEPALAEAMHIWGRATLSMEEPEMHGFGALVKRGSATEPEEGE